MGNQRTDEYVCGGCGGTCWLFGPRYVRSPVVIPTTNLRPCPRFDPEFRDLVELNLVVNEAYVHPNANLQARLAAWINRLVNRGRLTTLRIWFAARCLDGSGNFPLVNQLNINQTSARLEHFWLDFRTYHADPRGWRLVGM